MQRRVLSLKYYIHYAYYALNFSYVRKHTRSSNHKDIKKFRIIFQTFAFDLCQVPMLTKPDIYIYTLLESR